VVEHDDDPQAHEDELAEIVRTQGEGVTDRLDVLIQGNSPGGLAEAVRLAHTLKGLATATEARPLRDLARSLEAALTQFDPGDDARRLQLLSAVDAARGLIGGNPGAEAAARTASATLEATSRRRPPVGLPWARRAVFRRLRPLLPPLLRSARSHLRRVEEGRDRRSARREQGRQLELWGAASGLLGQTEAAALALELGALLQQRRVSSAVIGPAHQALDELERADPADEPDRPLTDAVIGALEPLRIKPPGVTEERIPISVEFPWPDVDQPRHLLRAIARASADRALLDARPSRPGVRSLRGTLGLGPRRRRRRNDGGSVQVPRRRLDKLLALSEELVQLRARTHALDRLAQELAEGSPPEARLGLRRLARRTAEFDRELDHLARATQESVLKARLVPLRGLFSLARVTVREHLSRHPERSVDLEVDGATTMIDKGLLDALVEPLLALLKNALQHGVEPQAERLAQGKPANAVVRLSARSTPAGVALEVEDDGRGLDEKALLRAGEAKGLVVLRDEREPGLSLAFAQGVTTAESVTDDAGRGVGLTSVLERVRSLRGRLIYRSQPQKGTLARVTVPPAVTTARVLLVRAGAEQYALPMSSVTAVLEIDDGMSREAPLIRLHDLVDPPVETERRRGQGQVPVERRMRDRFVVLITPPFTRGEGPTEGALACVVDDVIRRDLLVVRPLGHRFAPPGIDGAVILGGGQVVLVIDVWRLYMSHQTSGFKLPGWTRASSAEGP
jgi:chemotaxis protein histidine kinase CheA